MTSQSFLKVEVLSQVDFQQYQYFSNISYMSKSILSVLEIRSIYSYIIDIKKSVALLPSCSSKLTNQSCQQH